MLTLNEKYSSTFSKCQILLFRKLESPSWVVSALNHLINCKCFFLMSWQLSQCVCLFLIFTSLFFCLCFSYYSLICTPSPDILWCTIIINHGQFCKVQKVIFHYTTVNTSLQIISDPLCLQRMTSFSAVEMVGTEGTFHHQSERNSPNYIMVLYL